MGRALCTLTITLPSWLPTSTAALLCKTSGNFSRLLLLQPTSSLFPQYKLINTLYMPYNITLKRPYSNGRSSLSVQMQLLKWSKVSLISLSKWPGKVPTDLTVPVSFKRLTSITITPMLPTWVSCRFTPLGKKLSVSRGLFPTSLYSDWCLLDYNARMGFNRFRWAITYLY